MLKIILIPMLELGGKVIKCFSKQKIVFPKTISAIRGTHSNKLAFSLVSP